MTSHIKIKTASEIILCMCPANGRWHYNIRSSLICWAHAKYDSFIWWWIGIYKRQYVQGICRHGVDKFHVNLSVQLLCRKCYILISCCVYGVGCHSVFEVTLEIWGKWITWTHKEMTMKWPKKKKNQNKAICLIHGIYSICTFRFQPAMMNMLPHLTGQSQLSCNAKLMPNITSVLGFVGSDNKDILSHLSYKSHLSKQ